MLCCICSLLPEKNVNTPKAPFDLFPLCPSACLTFPSTQRRLWWSLVNAVLQIRGSGLLYPHSCRCTSVGLIHREEGDIYQGINRENQTKAAEGNKNKTNFCERDPTHCFSWTAEWPSNQMCHFWEVTKADVVHSKLEPQQGIQHANVKEHGMWTGDCNTASAPKCRNHTNTWKELFQMIEYVL